VSNSASGDTDDIDAAFAENSEKKFLAVLRISSLVVEMGSGKLS